MSWDEIKKAVNSDLNVPLDERATYFEGLFPRGLVSKKVTHELKYSTEGQESVMLEISGRGFVSSITHKGRAKRYYLAEKEKSLQLLEKYRQALITK